MRAACAWHDSQSLRVARFGDNMREVAVTEGDKVEAQIRFGYDVHGFGIGDLAARVHDTPDAEADRLLSEYDSRYAVAAELRPGQVANFKVRDNEKEYASKIVHVAAAADEGSRMVAITAEIRDTSDMALRPGAFAEITIPVSAPRTAPVVPQTALSAAWIVV